MAQRRNSAISVQILRKDITCPVCLEIFDDPKTLPKCAHVFCKNCLKSVVAANTVPRSSLECPVCRTRTSIPKEGVDAFVSALALKNLIDSNPALRQVITLKNQLKECDVAVNKNQSKLKGLEKSLKEFDAAQKNIEKLKSDVKERATKMNQIIELHCNKMCAMLDQARENNTQISKELLELKSEITRSMEEMQGYGEMVTDLISTNDYEAIDAKTEELATKYQNIVPKAEELATKYQRFVAVGGAKLTQVKYVTKSASLNGNVLYEMLGHIEMAKPPRPSTAGKSVIRRR